MNERWKSIVRVVVILALPILGGMVYLRATAGSLNGWWLKESGGGSRDSYPEQMTLRISHGKFLMRYWNTYGLTTVTCPIDGRGYTTAAGDRVVGTITSNTWWAEMKGNTLQLTKKYEVTPPKVFQPAAKFEDAWTETWAVAEDGQHLKITVPGSQDIVYVRAPWWAYLWRSAP